MASAAGVTFPATKSDGGALHNRVVYLLYGLLAENKTKEDEMIIWRGIGAVVLVIVFMCSLAANLITNALAGSETYYDQHKWPFGASLLVGAIITWLWGSYLQKRPGKVVIDKETGQEMELKKKHDFFFIPMKWWGPILAVIGIVAIGAEFVRK